jgi:hypothetical protein
MKDAVEIHYDRGGFFVNAIEIVSGGMIYIPIFINIG